MSTLLSQHVRNLSSFDILIPTLKKPPKDMDKNTNSHMGNLTKRYWLFLLPAYPTLDCMRMCMTHRCIASTLHWCSAIRMNWQVIRWLKFPPTQTSRFLSWCKIKLVMMNTLIFMIWHLLGQILIFLRKTMIVMSEDTNKKLLFG